MQIYILATFSTLSEARQARYDMSKLHDNLAIKIIDNTFKLIRYENTPSLNAMDTVAENTFGNHRNSVKSRKRRRNQSYVEQFQFD